MFSQAVVLGRIAIMFAIGDFNDWKIQKEQDFWDLKEIYERVIAETREELMTSLDTVNDKTDRHGVWTIVSNGGTEIEVWVRWKREED